MTNKTPRLTWNEADYSPVVAGSGARKLASSAVAPLVAAARGMFDVTPDNLRSVQNFLGCGRATAKDSMTITSAVKNTDALYMPWFTPQAVAEMRRDKVHLASVTPQFRPNPTNLTFDAHGKAAKYINMAGRSPIIGLHPAVPESWQLARGMRALFTEGMLKADSALTAMLLASGIKAKALKLHPDDLAITDPLEQTVAHRQRLAGLMEQVPEADRIMVYGFLSVTTFSKNPEWRAVDVRGQDVFVAFDGDLAINPMVWKSGRHLFEFITDVLKATPKLIDLSEVSHPDGLGAKCGIDDYLAGLGTWPELLALATEALPPKPETDEARPGEWRCNDKLLITEEYVAGPTADDPGSWREKYPFVARVSAVEDRRQVLLEEAESGVYIERTDARDMDSRVEIEVAWIDPLDGKHRIGVITGPHELLMASPSEWRRITPKPAIPSSVALLPAWPPREPEFLKAMKKYRLTDLVVRPLWSHMGWVPTKDDVPVFLVGDQVVGADGLVPHAAACGVNAAELRVAPKFGVQIPDSDDEVREALRSILDAYRPEDASLAPFRNPRHASIVLAAGLRPCVPGPCQAPVLFTGSSGGGKSWAASAMMMFWQRRPGTWTEKSLPGSAMDTYASTEVAISKTPIWVVDDLAPSEDDLVGSGRKANALFETIRNVHNGGTRARRGSDMRAMEQNPPRALMISTAEQTPEHQQSIMNRSIHIKVRAGQFLSASRQPTDKLVELGSGTSPQSLLSGYCLIMLAKRARRHGWKKLLADVAAEKKFHKVEALSLVDDSPQAERQAETIADLALGLSMLDWIARDLGMAEELADRLAMMRYEMYQAAEEGYHSAQEIVLGPQFIAALRSTLRARNAHVGALGLAGVPMSAGNHGNWSGDVDFVNDALGWTPGENGQPAKPGGPRIGDLLFDKQGNPCILFDPKAAFQAVKKSNDGFRSHSVNETWDSVVIKGFRHDAWAPRRSGGGAGRTQRVRQDGVTVEGIAVLLTKLLDAEIEDTEEA